MKYYQNEYYKDEVKEILVKLVKLQKEAVKDESEEQMCDYNFLGNCGHNACDCNTRPLQIYTINDKAWFCPINRNEDDCTQRPDETTCVFRVEKVEGDTATFRALVQKSDNHKKFYCSTDSYITIKLVSIAAIRCLHDCYVDLCIN